MGTSPSQSYIVRKNPVQARASITVGAICEAAIQLLLKSGLKNLTTIRIAKRAGVSVGTYYQYFPNKQALLLTLVRQYLSRVTKASVLACQSNCGKPRATMVSAFLEAYIAAPLAHLDEARAVYSVARSISSGPIVAQESKIVVDAIAEMFRTLPALPANDVDVIASTFFGAVAGATRAALEVSPAADLSGAWEKHLERLGQAYLASFEDQSLTTGIERENSTLGFSFADTFSASC